MQTINWLEAVLLTFIVCPLLSLLCMQPVSVNGKKIVSQVGRSLNEYFLNTLSAMGPDGSAWCRTRARRGMGPGGPHSASGPGPAPGRPIWSHGVCVLTKGNKWFPCSWSEWRIAQGILRSASLWEASNKRGIDYNEPHRPKLVRAKTIYTNWLLTVYAKPTL